MGSPVLVGTVTLDLLHEGPIGAGRPPVVLRWGGVMGNTACALGMRGVDPVLVTVTYTGELAAAVSAHLAANRVRWAPLPVSLPLPLFHAELVDGSVKHKVFIGDEALSALTPAELEAGSAVPADASVVVAGTDAEEETLAWLADVAAARGLPFWLLSADPTEVGKLRPNGRGADLVALNLPELSGWAGRALTGRADIVAAARELAAPGGRCLVTLGAEGALLVRADDAEVTFQPAPPIEHPPLAVGAGDVLFGCLLAARLDGVDWATALERASILTGTFLRGVASDRFPYHALDSAVVARSS
ncbi:carbohydrate kinase family protein [Micromonospora okii]|uniref:carbohydrate kinase family protein n=1 Tax=Micromonospora okii TaxID=1182970 RepID=UPI001E56F6A6|nr:PfkB family carbohydrate kinase [Micromonospora okii]